MHGVECRFVNWWRRLPSLQSQFQSGMTWFITKNGKEAFNRLLKTNRISQKLLEEFVPAVCEGVRVLGITESPVYHKKS